MSEPVFEEFPKIPRLSRTAIITEKIDGTNAAILVGEDGSVRAGSKTKWIVPGNDDNHGFAQWVQDHADELRSLGPGLHRGEWWGYKIQRGYGLKEKRFSLYNTGRWRDSREGGSLCPPLPGSVVAPDCCHVVPILSVGEFETLSVHLALWYLKLLGSRAAPGFMRPEGVVVYHTALGGYFKKTLEKDDAPKSKGAA